MILEKIQTPNDVKSLSAAELKTLCAEIRMFLLDKVSKSGGHLASNLGAVELTVAIHRVFDTSRDRLVFDVGHQCYVHKMLTGRMEGFDHLRQMNGISGFPKPRESAHDAFIAGHASNSVSVALGMARARTLLKEDYSVLALIGDGALTGGLAYEGLNNAGASGEPLIVILNDNGMSIGRNVGAMSRHLGQLRTNPDYYEFKKNYRETLEKSGVGRVVYNASHKLKSELKKAVVPAATMFEDMGFTYVGPVDGHDVEKVSDALRYARELNKPVLVHVHTVKGKGYGPAEREPQNYHGVGAFDLRTGVSNAAKPCFSTAFGDELCAIAAKDKRICAITAAMEDGTGLSKFAKLDPKRFFDVGIAEGHAAAMAAGMAKQGLVPVFAVYSSFLQRAYDQLIHDTALQNLHVVFAVDRAGMVGADGETHHGIFDATFLSDIPNMTVLCPSNYAELCAMLRRAVNELTGPVAIRYPRGGEGGFRDDRSTENFAVLREGADITLCAYGTMVNQILEAADILAEKGISARVLKCSCISPFLDRDFRAVVGKCRALLVAEEATSVGCVGQRMAAILAENNLAPEHLVLCNLNKNFPPQGTSAELLNAFGLDAASIAAKAMEVLR